MNLLDMRPAEALAALRARGLDAVTARRALTACIREGVPALERVRGISVAAREGLERDVALPRLEIRERRVDPSDGFAKYLLATGDGLLVEAVRIPLLTRDPGPGEPLEKRFTVCLSSEAGCAMGCTFCATARMGLLRRLEAWEIVAQLRAVRDEAPGRISGAVLMGMGEPFDNWERVSRALDVLEDDGGIAIGKRNVTVSTVGHVPGIERFADEERRERLAFSMVTAVEEKRRRMVPLARKHDLASVKAALRRVISGPGRHKRVLVAIVMIGGVTTTEEDARAAVEYLADLPCWIDLIDVNDARDGLRPPGPEERARFISMLREAGHPIQVRYSGGRAIEAGCGMLAATSAGGLRARTSSGILAHPRNGAGPVQVEEVVSSIDESSADDRAGAALVARPVAGGRGSNAIRHSPNAESRMRLRRNPARPLADDFFSASMGASDQGCRAIPTMRHHSCGTSHSGRMKPICPRPRSSESGIVSVGSPITA